MKVWVLGSGSRGNATVLDNGSTRVLVDAGFSTRELKRRMAVAGLPPESVDAMIVTHEHTDHACGAARAARRWRWPVHATRGTIANTPDLETVNVVPFRAGATITIGTMAVQTVAVSHDATDPIAIVASDIVSGARAAVVVDLGRLTSQLRDVIREVDVLVLESNHDEAMLATGPYPISVQRRIAGVTGHLSNRQAATVARVCAHSGLQHLVLAHLSEQCNTPDHALATMSTALARTRFRGRLSAASQDVVHGAFVAGRRGVRAQQLAFALDA